MGSSSSTKQRGGKTITISDDTDDSDEESDFEAEAEQAKRPSKNARISNATSRSKKVSDEEDSEDQLQHDEYSLIRFSILRNTRLTSITHHFRLFFNSTHTELQIVPRQLCSRSQLGL